MMKRLRLCLLLMLVLLSAACANQAAVTTYTPQQIADIMIASQSSVSVLHPLLPDDDYFPQYVSEIYEIGNREITGGIIYYTAGMQADEFAVFILNEGANGNTVKKALEDYIARRLAAFTGYAPDQAAILENGKAVLQGRHVALIICEDAGSAQAAFIACFSGNPPPVPQHESTETPSPDVTEAPAQSPSASPDMKETPSLSPSPDAEETPSLPPTPDAEETPPDATDSSPLPSPPATPATDFKDDAYNPDAIIKAYRSGDTSALTPKNRSIYEACVEIIFQLITPDMSDYDKELAIHDRIIITAGYDREANSNAPDAKPDPDNDNPYGLLINGKAICTGYTSTFQLFMDLLEIECITVHGHAITGGEHAWNMVFIEGEWYCVDVTWNDPTNLNGTRLTSENHRYFNVPGQFLKEAGHVWDEGSTPQATAPKLYR